MGVAHLPVQRELAQEQGPGDVGCHLAGGEEVSFPVEDPAGIRQRVEEWLEGIAAGRFDPTPGEHCRVCDFLSFCEAGRAYVEGAAGAPSPA